MGLFWPDASVWCDVKISFIHSFIHYLTVDDLTTEYERPVTRPLDTSYYQKQGQLVHTCPDKSDLRGVNTGSMVTLGSGQRVQCLEMAASRE